MGIERIAVIMAVVTPGVRTLALVTIPGPTRGP